MSPSLDIYSLRKRNLELQNIYLERKIQKIDIELAGSSSNSKSKRRIVVDSDTSSLSGKE